jgi:hypothetical protein
MRASAPASQRITGSFQTSGSCSDAFFLREKIGTARFYAEQLLPQTAGLLPAVTSDAGPLLQTDLSRAVQWPRCQSEADQQARKNRTTATWRRYPLG